ncbi:MAG: sn-glycerol-3-phosphate ABC transporter permease UgpE [Candidatus Acetothermia bacterium]|jgi:sn-glycerol 3-phosphate transport system permease protein|nr:sn-glycerol-3-phosphate ABC transporter permease UgpE [Candidatus Acetothermia bacterium]
MPKRFPQNWLAHVVLLLGVAILAFPVYMAVVGSTHDAATIGRGRMPLTPGPYAAYNYAQAWAYGTGERVSGTPVRIMMLNSFLMAITIAIGKIAVSILAAYAVVFFRFPLRMFFFWLIFITLMLPLEVRIIPSYKVISDFGLINTFAGLTIPLMVSATGTLLFRQVFLTIPKELLDAAKIDGAGPMRCLWSIILPLGRPSIAALFVILFVYGWNQYLWPLLITTERNMDTVVIGIVKMLGTSESLMDWNLVMATTVMAMAVPIFIVILLQRWLVKGLVETEK